MPHNFGRAFAPVTSMACKTPQGRALWAAYLLWSLLFVCSLAGYLYYNQGWSTQNSSIFFGVCYCCMILLCLFFAYLAFYQGECTKILFILGICICCMSSICCIDTWQILFK